VSARRAEKIPGALPRESISSPESLKACFAAMTPNWEKRSHLLDS